MKILGVLLVFVCISLPVFGQEENWDSYMAKYGGKPGSVLVDLALMSSAPDKLLPYLVVTGPRTKNCLGLQGIPDADEINSLENILDATDNYLTGVTAKKLAGTFTYNCERLNYYYVRDTVGVRNAIGRMYANKYGDYQYTTKIKHDPRWMTYRTFLYPDSVATAWMTGNKILLSMVKDGDDLKEQRDIKHTAYFMTDTGREQFAGYAKTHRYTEAGRQESQGKALPYEIAVSRFGHVQIDSILAMENELKNVAKSMKGYYKGWDAKQRIK